MSKSSTKVKRNWNEKAYTRLVLFIPKDEADRYKRKCTEQGRTFSEVPKAAITQFLEDE